MFPFFSYFLTFSLLCSLPCFPARKLSDPISKLTASDINNTWRAFAKFLDAGKGSHVSGMSDLKRYFQRFGYLDPTPGSNLTDTFDKSFQDAVVSYQKSLGLQVSGKLDSATMSQIISPRCGVSDKSRIHTTRHYTYFFGQPRWMQQTPMTLTYAFSPDHMIDYLSQSDIKSAFGKAFARWSEVIPVNFTEAENYHSADVKIGFYGGDHGDGEPFDGVLGILAHAFSPENGRFHLDSAETWAVDFSTQKSKAAVDLESVATHEIGHVLGLAHSSVKEAIMYPSLSPRTKKVDLKIDDVEGVQALYGSNPNFKFSSLLESDTSSSWAVGLRTGSSVWDTCAVIIAVLIGTLCL